MSDWAASTALDPGSASRTFRGAGGVDGLVLLMVVGASLGLALGSPVFFVASWTVGEGGVDMKYGEVAT